MPREELYGSHVKREYERKQLQISTEDCSLQLFQELNPAEKQSIVIWGNGSHIKIKSFYRKKTYFRGEKNHWGHQFRVSWKSIYWVPSIYKPLEDERAKAVRGGGMYTGHAAFQLQLDFSTSDTCKYAYSSPFWFWVSTTSHLLISLVSVYMLLGWSYIMKIWSYS